MHHHVHNSWLAILISALCGPAFGNEVEHKTRFDPEMIPGIRNKVVTLPLSNSRQIVRARTGQWLVVFDVPNEGLYFAYGPAGAAQGSTFQEPILMVGDGKPGTLGTGTRPMGASIALTDSFLYIAWFDKVGVWVAKIALSDATGPNPLQTLARTANTAELITPEGSMGDILADKTGRILVAYSTHRGVFVATESGSKWIHEKVSGSGTEPVMDVDRDGRLHLVYRNERETPFFGRLALDPRISYTVHDDRGWQPSQIVAEGLSFLPAIAASHRGRVVAFQHEGLKVVKAASPHYLEDREGAGASIGYTASANGGWHTGFVSQAQEIVVRNGSVVDGSVGGLYPMVEQKWRPRMAKDKYGIPWVFWPDTTRRHTYFARWLGSRFSDEYECRGGYYAPSEYITVEKQMPSNAAEIGFAYAAAGRLYFGTVPVPAALTDDSRHYLFLDMLDVSEMEGVRRDLNQFRKYANNPVLKPAAPGNWDDYGISFPNVRMDGSKFTMEYSGHGAGGEAGAWGHGYAESRDGIDWIRPRLGLIDYKGDRNNNQIPWVPNFRDLAEPDPNRRYKGILIEGNWITNFRRPIAFSPDGLHWEFGQDTVNLTSMLEGGGPAFRDELDIPERRFKSIGRTISQNHRALGMMWSPDLIHWYGDEAILDVSDPYGKPALQWRGRYVAGRILDPSGEKTGDQIYWGTVWIENGVYLCLYAPFRYDGGYQAALAMSRDGLNYMRIANGQFVLPRGPAGAWDSGFIAVGYGFNVPLHINNKVRVYYGGVTSHHGTDPWRASAAIGMAELPEDGWTFISPELGAPSSYITSIPITVATGHRAQLYVNADLPSGRGSLRVEVLDGVNDLPIPGYSREDCRPVSGVAGKALVSWKQSHAIGTRAERVRLRFYLTGAESRLYSFWFK